jgi:hypothetical protein
MFIIPMLNLKAECSDKNKFIGILKQNLEALENSGN